MARFLKAMLISVCSIAVFMGAGLSVEAHEYCEEEQVHVEHYEDTAVTAAADEVVYYESVEEVGAALREGMVARKETIEVGFTTTKELDNSIIDEFMDEALKHTKVPTEGDYLKGHYMSYKATASGKSKNGVYNWVFTYTVKYRTTVAQEEKTDKAVAEILSGLKLGGKDTYQKVKTIYDYMCKNIAYDWDNVDDDSNTIKHSAYAAAVKKTAVCQGYSSLLYRLLLESGIDCRVINGTGNSKAHSWNIVEIDGLYYYLDATFDSADATNKWFLKGEDVFKDYKAKDTYNYPISDTQYYYDGEHDHEYETVKTKATFTKNGKTQKKCRICGEVTSSKSIAKVSSVKLSASTYTYNGKARTPSVTVKDSKGNVLSKDKHYTLSYSKGRKNVGQYTVKVTLKGNYSGSKKVYFKIRPKATKISSLKAGSKCFTVKYSKVASQTSGYQVQYSTSSSFESAKSVLVKDNKTVSKKIKSLKAKKKYYVRVRTYKTVKINGESTRIYSAWSEKKSVKTTK